MIRQDCAPPVLIPDRAAAAELRAAFLRDGYVEVQTYIVPGIFAELKTLVAQALDRAGRRRDILMPATDRSPRFYTLAGRQALAETSPRIGEIYAAPALLELLSLVTGEAVTTVPYVPEEFVAARYERAGDTHGWHWDDYAFALIWVFAAPDADDGGALEWIQHIPWDKTRPGVAVHTAAHIPQRRHPAAGTVYLLRTDTTLHRVTPLIRNAHREIACLSYASGADAERTITHETLEALIADGS